MIQLGLNRTRPTIQHV